MKIKSKKSALLLSFTSLLVCFAMLVGSTFAWFTDTASTGVNQIKSGNLKMKVEYSKDMITWQEVSAEEPIFEKDALWEPGRTEIVYVRVTNVGTLALRYNFDVSTYAYGAGQTEDGDDIYLYDYLMFGSAETDAVYGSREEAIKAVATNERILGTTNIAVANKAVLKSGEISKVSALVLYMPTTVGNEANYGDNSWWAPYVEVGVKISATQATVENDSFGNDYDAEAPSIFETVEYWSGEHTVTEGVMAPGKWGSVQVSGGTTTLEAGVTSTAKDNGAVAVWASSGGTVIINKGTFTQEKPGNDDHYDFIYASGGGKIVINGGTFKAVTPKWTLNCKDNSGSTITVKGGTFYQFDPSNAEVGTGEIIVPTGYHVEQNGDWYTVVAND